MTPNQPYLLWGLFGLQALCAVFFAADTYLDFFGGPETQGDTSDVIEAFVTLCLVIGAIFTGFEIRKVFRREAQLKRQIDVASGAFADIMQREFDAWGLTESERTVAMFGIKGYSIAEIADLRQTKEGTIKAQNAAVYRKAGVSGRLQLLSHFVEDLIDENLIPARASNPARDSENNQGG